MAEEKKNPFLCFWCGAEYYVIPSEHICLDGTTHQQRILKRQDYDTLRLTPADVKMLKGMKIDPNL